MNQIATLPDVEPAQEGAATMLQVIERAASNPAVDIDKLERLMAMSERMQERAAEQAFNEALRSVQAEAKTIRRNKRNEQTSSNYSDLEAVNNALVPIYTKHGFSLSFGMADSPLAECVRVTGTLSHSAGHSRGGYFYDVPIDATGLKGAPNKTRTHAFGSSSSYGRRYLTLLIFNVSTGDDDGNGAQKNTMPMTDEHLDTIETLCAGFTPHRLPVVLKSYKAEKLSEIPDVEYESIVRRLQFDQKKKADK